MSCIGSKDSGGAERPELGVATSAKSTNYDDLVSLFGEWREFVKAKISEDGVPDYTPTAIAAQKEGLEKMQAKLASIDPHS